RPPGRAPDRGACRARPRRARRAGGAAPPRRPAAADDAREAALARAPDDDPRRRAGGVARGRRPPSLRDDPAAPRRGGDRAAMRPVRALLLYARLPENETLSYQQAWPRHFVVHPRFRCDPVDVISLRDSRRLRLRALLRRARYDAVVILHSVFSNGRYPHGPPLEP